jgi:antitoxin VapB
MGKEAKIDAERERWRKGMERIFGRAPWLKPREKAHYRAKVFRSGNSLALRLPAGLELTPGMEMDLTVEDGVFFSFEPIDLPKKKFNIAKVCGSATSLEFIKPEDRVFEERPLLWEKLGKNAGEDEES